jgi:non-specific serine/threonine protein kinase/serine/threonine-protein kinase
VTGPEQQTKISEIVGEALRRNDEERLAFLDEACEGNYSLRTQVETVISIHDQGEGLSAQRWGEAFNAPAEMLKTIGPFRLERELGVGGMGQVWLAEQTEPVRRWVALKLIRAGLYDPQVTQRFISERQSLALMNHPAIAKVFDAGTTPAGQPYLVMEYVDGSPITEYCDHKKLSIAERLRLFQLVCEGVQHAHQKAIIHRDLKPSNILVVEVDGKPVPRIIDFGLAKAVVSVADGETMLTQVGSFLGTPGYMSPEQADPLSEDIDTRADVYSLGVVLYELLTGYLPFDSTRWKKQRLDEVIRELKEADPIRPSTRVSSNRNPSDTHADARSMESRQLVTQLRGDLDWITMKALEKERDRRYGGPAELAADIERYLLNRPVLARPVSTFYQVSKYVRRNRIAVAVGAGVLVLLIAFAVAEGVQLRRITRERDRADRITGFMTNMFQVSDPSEARGNTVTAREILDKSSKEIESGLGEDAAVQSQLMEVMAKTYMNLGLYSRADGLAERALVSRRRTVGPDDPKTLESMAQLGLIQYHEGQDVEAESLLRNALAEQSRILKPDDLLTAETKDSLVGILTRQAHYAEAEKLEREVVAVRTRKLGAENIKTLNAINNLVTTLQRQGKAVDAETTFRQVLAVERRVLGDGHPTTLATMHNFANMLADEDRFDEAEALYRETLQIQRHVLGPEHPETTSTMTTLANTLGRRKSGRVEAEALYRESLAIEIRVLGPEHSYTTRTEEGLANLLSSEHHYPEAAEILRRVLATRQRQLGPNHTDTLLTGYNLADVELHEGHYAEAETLIRETLASQARVLDPNDPDTMASKTLLGRILLKEKKPLNAEVYLRQAFDAQLRVLGPEHGDTQESLGYLTDALAATGRYPEASKLYADTIVRIRALPKGDASVAWYNYAVLAATAGHRDDAFAYLHQAVEAGYSDSDSLRADEDLKSLRNDPRFADVLTEAQKRASLTAQPSH